MKLVFKDFIFIAVVCYNAFLADASNIFDLNLYESVLDTAECERQLTYIRNNDTALRLRFIDASWRIPRSILKGNTRDLGRYYECIDISENIDNLDMFIGGKFCSVQFPLQQDDLVLPTLPNLPEFNITLPEFPSNREFKWSETVLDFPWKHFDPETTFFTNEIRAKMAKYEQLKAHLGAIVGDVSEDTSFTRSSNGSGALDSMAFELAVCMPKVCTTKQALDFFSNNLTTTMNYDEVFCRLPNDKKWVAADTVAVIILSIIGLITLLSTAYDITHSILLKNDPKKINSLYQTFSIYTNSKNLFVFPTSSSAVTCLDGIRSFAMIWVIVGHTYVTQVMFPAENPLDILNFMMEFTSLWITSATITVDTFFVISGLLVVYVSAAKMSRNALVKNLHLFYLNRILRMMPVLAFGVLMMASFLIRTVDGPRFTNMENVVDACRQNWWSTLLFVQNFVHPSHMCLPHSWYLAIDMQLHILSPIVLFWVLGQRKRSAWWALGSALAAVIIGSTIYNFLNDFPSITLAMGRSTEDNNNFFNNYYIHTLPRAAPFFVGMIFGYILHLYRKKPLKLPMALVFTFWVLTFVGTSGVCMITYWNIQPDWDNQLMDNFINSYQRVIWSLSIGWLVFACHKGYGGPINWVLSLTIFKILGRLSFAMYILHYPLIYLINTTSLGPIYFASHFSFYRFFVDFTLAVIAAYLVTIIIDYPFANLIKMVLGATARRRPQPQENPEKSVQENGKTPQFENKSRTDFESGNVVYENKTKF